MRFSKSMMRPSYKISIILSVFFLFCLLIVLATGVNEVLFVKINSSAALLSSFIWANLTFLGDTMAACAIMLLFIRKRPDLVWSGIMATILASLIVNLVKSYYDIPRPAAIIDKDSINIIGPALYQRAFPSGHTVTIFTLTGILMFYFRSAVARLSMVFLAFLVGMSRIAVGAHWPADVLAGAALGLMCAVTGVYLVTKFGWNSYKPLQLAIGFILIVSVFYLLLFYDSRYEQANDLKYLLSVAVLIAGIREYILLLKRAPEVQI